MAKILLLLLGIGLISPLPAVSGGGEGSTHGTEAFILHTYEARIRLNGKVSTAQVKASDAGQAKKLVQQQFPEATVLSVKKVD